MKNEEVSINPTYTEVITFLHALKWEQSKSERYLEYRHKWVEYPKKQIVSPFPLHLDIETTRRCNLKCPMCPRTIKLGKDKIMRQGDMTFPTFKKIIDEGSKEGLYSVKLNYLGEPLMCKELPQMIRYAKEKGIVDVMINTNGVLLSKNLSEELMGAGLDQIFISFDSPYKEQYEKIRVGANFEKVLENVKSLITLRNEKKKISPLIRADMVVMKENRSDVLDYLKLWSPLADKIGFTDLTSENQKNQHNPFFICSQLYQRLVIQWDGEIGLCCSDYEAEQGLGYSQISSIKDVWVGEKMQAIRKKHNNGEWDKIPLCKGCDIPYNR